MLRELHSYLTHLRQRRRAHAAPATPPLVPKPRPLPLAHPTESLPDWVQACPVARHYHALLAPLDWAHFPERPTDRPWPGPEPAPRAPFAAAYLIKLAEQQRYMTDLRRFLIQHPALVWLLGFPLVLDPTAPHGFDVAASVPKRRQFNRVLRTLPNDALQFLLSSSITCIKDRLSPEQQAQFAQTVAGDTKHILAWVKENNPKQYVDERYDPTRQPVGDPDCTLGVKKRRNAPTPGDTGLDATDVPTPTCDAQPASQAGRLAEYHWGYASGVIATILPDGLGEIVLAERTRPFHENDITYFFPLMEQTERVLGHRPRNGTFAAAFDAFYVYAYFHQAGGIAAVPLVERRMDVRRRFSPDGLPLCAAGLPMPRKFVYRDRTNTCYPHDRGKHVCPLHYPAQTAEQCPIGDRHGAKGGCATTIATSIGARMRIELDRESADYKAIYQQRTVVERINSQAVEWGIERPKLRNGRSITNQNPLIYVLMNLRVVQRMQRNASPQACQEVTPTVSS